MVVAEYRRPGSANSSGGGDESLGNTRRDSLYGCCRRRTQPLKGNDDSNNCSEEADEGCGAGCRCQPSHTLLEASRLLDGNDLHRATNRFQIKNTAALRAQLLVCASEDGS